MSPSDYILHRCTYCPERNARAPARICALDKQKTEGLEFDVCNKE
jgi:hypothetical protein